MIFGAVRLQGLVAIGQARPQMIPYSVCDVGAPHLLRSVHLLKERPADN